jgi:hypothetical protein
MGNIFICGDNALLRKSPGLSRFEKLEAVPDIDYSWLFRLAPRGTKGLVTIGKNGWIYAGTSNGNVWRKMR